MEVVAQKDGVIFLVHVADDERGEPLGVVVDVEDKIVHRPFNIHSIISRGYWEEPSISVNSEKALVMALTASWPALPPTCMSAAGL